MQHESISLRAVRKSESVRGKWKLTLLSLVPLASGPGEPGCGLHLHPAASTSVCSPSPHGLQETGWLFVAPCCATVTWELAANSIPLVFPPWPGNEYRWKEMKTKKQWQGEKPEQCFPAPTMASSDQPDQSTAGEGQCKGSGFLSPNQQA